MSLSPFLLGRFALGLVLSTLLGWAALRYLGPRGFMDVPDGRKRHQGAIPRTGGAAFVAVMLVGLAAGWCTLPFSRLEWAGMVAMATVGLADDRYNLRARWKALVGLGVALALASVGATRLLGQGLDLHLLGCDLPDTFSVYFGLLTLLYWCVPQSFNLIDGMNGLALGYAVVVLGALALTGHVHPYTLGAVGGVLVWNWPRARHFLGDCGSMAMGLLLALLVKKGIGGVDPDRIFLVFAYPFVDTTMVVVLRLAKGHHPARADRSHLHHRWQDVLVGRECWVAPILLTQAGLCATGVVARGWWWALPVLGLVLMVAQAVVFSLRDLRKPRAGTGGVSSPQVGGGLLSET